MCSTPFGIKDQLRPHGDRVRCQIPDVLNAFRHQRSTQDYFERMVPLAIRCSTPFGIKDQLSSAQAICFSVPALCSTPFGIKDQLSPITQFWHLESVRAQRLSASKINSVCLHLYHARFPLCSTPFGIKDQLRPLNRFSCFPSSLCSTPFGIKDQLSPAWACLRQNMNRAQRLSASKINSGLVEQSRMGALRVLNAFRHQRSTQSLRG